MYDNLLRKKDVCNFTPSLNNIKHINAIKVIKQVYTM